MFRPAGDGLIAIAGRYADHGPLIANTMLALAPMLPGYSPAALAAAGAAAALTAVVERQCAEAGLKTERCARCMAFG